MLRHIKLSVDQLLIDPNSTLSHTGTSYQVSDTPDFTGALILDLVNSATSLLEHTLTYDLLPNAPLYVRTKYHFSTGMASSWSNIVDIPNTQIGMKSSNTIVATPAVSVSYDYSNNVKGEVVVRLDNLAVYAGIGSVVAASWKIESLDGDVVFDLPESTSVLSELILPITELNGLTYFMVTAVIHTNTSTKSNPGRIISVIPDSNVIYFNTELKNSLYRNAYNKLLITEHSNDYVAANIRVMLPDNSLIASFDNLDPYISSFKLADLDINGYYTADVRMLTSNGDYTPWVNFYSGPVYDYNIRQYSDTVTYPLTEVTFGAYVDFNGMSSQTTHADEDNVFYLAVPETNTLEAYRTRNGAMYSIGRSFDLPANNLFNIPTINMIPLYDGDYLLDHAVATYNGDIEVSKFTMLNYNRITKKLTKITSFVRPDERYGTGRVSSAVATRDGLLYYVPGEIFDAQDTQLDLELRVFDIVTKTIIDNIPLPVTGLKENVSISEDKYGNIYMFGGTGGPVNNAAHAETVRLVKNTHIYKLDKVNKTWMDVFTVPLLNADSYRYRMQTLRNGKILIIDATPNIVGTGTRSSYLYDPMLNVIDGSVINNPSKEHIGISIELRDGDIGLMSSTSDLVEAVGFVTTNTSSVANNATAITTSQAVLDLVVPVGEVVYIRDPYRYNSIVIEGTSLVSTGKVVWIRDNLADEYLYNDLIVTRNMSIAAATVYNKVTVVGDATLTVV